LPMVLVHVDVVVTRFKINRKEEVAWSADIRNRLYRLVLELGKLKELIQVSEIEYQAELILRFRNDP
jgi:hypothetical protein